MRRPVRQIEVFDISLMAVVTKAMGAFLVMMLLLLPYYRSNPDIRASARDVEEALQKAQAQIAEMQKRLATQTGDPAELRRLLEDARKRLEESARLIDKLTRQAQALSSQLEEARKRLQEAVRQAALAQAAAKDAASRATAAEQARQAAERRAQAAEAAAAREQQAEARARQAELAAQAAAQREQQAQQAAQAAQQQAQAAEQASAQAQAQANAQRQLLGHATRAVNLDLFVAWHQSDACGDSIGRLRYYEFGNTIDATDAAVLGDLRNGYASRSEQGIQLRLTDPASPGQKGLLPPISLFESGSASLLDFLFVAPDKPVPAGCMINATVLLVDFNGARSTGWQNLPVAAGTDPSLLLVVDSKAKNLATLPGDADKARFASVALPAFRKQQADEAKARARTPPEGAPAPVGTP